MDSIKTLLSQINKFWAGKDSRFKRNAVIIASGVLVVIIVACVLFNHVDYAELYSGLDSTDSSAVIAALEAQNVSYRVSGNAILVPAADADRLKLSLSPEVKGSFNLDILDKGQGLGMTESQRDDYRKYQIVDHIEKAIETLQGVKAATAAVTMGTDSGVVLQTNKREATAGVILTLEDGVELKPEQIASIAAFVQKSVPGLQMENISLMDSNMNNLDIGGEETEISASDRYALQNDVQSGFRKQILALLQPVFGLGKVEAQVNVTLDFDERTTDSVRFEPAEGSTNGIVASIEKLREEIVNNGESGGEPGTEANTGTATYPVVSVDNGTYEKNSEKINYEITTIKQHLEEEKGAIKSLSVSVIVDNTGVTEDYADTVAKLVSTAVGVDPEYITVSFMPMNGSTALADALAQENASAEALARSQQTRFYVILGAVVLLVVVAMALVASNRAAKRKTELALQTAALGVPVEGVGPEPVVGGAPEEPGLEDIMIVKENGTKEQIGKLIQSNPELVANLLRSWLADEQE